MSIGTVQKDRRDELGITQQELGNMTFQSRATIAAQETGRRTLAKDLAPRVNEVLDCGFVSMETAHALTGGAWMTKLDGKNVDLHRSSVHIKTREETQEALEAMEHMTIANPPAYANEQNREQLKEAMIQVLDSIVAQCHLVSVICKDYGFSWLGLWKEWHKKAKRRGYVNK